MSIYYNKKAEGLTRLYTDPRLGSGTVDYYYDSFERSLFVPPGRWAVVDPVSAAGLCRDFKNHEALEDRRLKRTSSRCCSSPMASAKPPSERAMFRFRRSHRPSTGYWPYANISTKYYPRRHAEGRRAGDSCFARRPARQRRTPRRGSSPADFRNKRHFPSRTTSFSICICPRPSAIETLKQARHADPQNHGARRRTRSSARGRSRKDLPHRRERLHDLNRKLQSPPGRCSGTGGNRQSTDDDGEVAVGRAVSRRMILDGKELQTDFKLDDPTGGPMGQAARRSRSITPSSFSITSAIPSACFRGRGA